ncbi:MAG: metal-dependent transcriptional regulator [Cyclobacteriaceae bacterium]
MIQSLSLTEENYLKAIYHLSKNGSESVNTNSLAESMNTTPASVNDMMKKLSNKSLIGYKKYKGATLLPDGEKSALHVIRKHRLWEVFLVQKLNFKWDEVHEIAEQLEHIKSPILVKRLDEFLGHPTIDPHGDPIPDENGIVKEVVKAPLSEFPQGSIGMLVNVSNDDPSLLQHLDKLKISLGSKIEIVERMEFDGSISISIDNTNTHFISNDIAKCLLITILD